MSENGYKIREVDGFDDEIAGTLHELNRLSFPGAKLSDNDFSTGHWWFAKQENNLVAWAGVVPSVYPNAGYFKRVGVAEGHRGHGLQRRLMRCIEIKAKRNGWTRLYSDTTDNVPSANNFIKARWLQFEPAHKWAFQHSIYWTKKLV